MYKKSLLLLSASLSFSISFSQIKWPAVTNTSKPWTRWWWEGSAVNKKDLTWNLEQYQQVGLGGVEITPIYGVKGEENKFIRFLSPQWMEMLQHTLNEAKRLNLGVDLANGTGWPFGGPWVKEDDASKSVYLSTYKLSSGQRLQERIEYNRQALIRTANNKPAAIDSILNPVYVNKNLQDLALDQIQYPGKLPLVALIAYSNGNSPVDLTQKVDANGNLDWQAPEGEWTLYALFEGLHGKMVERAAPGGEGYAIDHFSAKAAENYFKRFDTAFSGYDLSYLRGFFNDSYEVDDARGEANWTPDFLNEFKKRKGYDLRDHLPALFGKDEASKNSKVIYDYRSVIDELILENFTHVWKSWGDSKGKILRNQSHGSPANTLDLYSVVDIPETEGTDILRFKFATSAANVTGKKLVAAESATWLNDHFLSSWADVKKAVDQYFLGGVNHIVYHGTAYSPKDASWPGWLFYAAVHFQPVNPQWKDFHALNSYITRVQSFLQTSMPDNEVLLYYPIADRYSQPGNYLLQHFDGMEKNFERTDFEHVANWMLEKGYGFDFFSDRQLQQFSVSGSRILTGGNTYKTILFPANKLLPAETISKLLELKKQGAKIVFYKNLPNGIPGLIAGEKDIALIQQLVSVFGNEAIVSDDLEKLLSNAGVNSELFVDHQLSVLRKKNANGKVYFINNRNADEFKGWITLGDNPQSVGLFDAMTDKMGLAKTRINSEGKQEVFLVIPSYGSLIIQCYEKKQVASARFPYYEAGGKGIEIAGPWTIEFLEGGPVVPQRISTDKLQLWTDRDEAGYKDFSGTTKYTVNFSRPKTNATSFVLDLGKVHETAEVVLNGKKIATLIGPTYQCIIPSSSLQQNNRLEIIVANLMANRIAYMDRNNIPWKIFYNINMPANKRENVKNGLFDASHWKPLASGIAGPVRLTPVKLLK